jgi:hypothetical protein
VLTIGNSRVFELAKVISNSLNIPYLTIKSDTKTDPTIYTNDDDDKYELNMHPPTSKIMEAIMDLINHYKWTSITVFYQDPSRIEYLIRLNGKSKHKFDFKYLDTNSSIWYQHFKELRQTGSNNFIIDIKTNLINKFIHLVNFVFDFISYEFII